ncbi:MAG: GNAT family N-acetyltransferase [Achromobacter sp.]|uniref:GNAT family N-acetyltransferase n=1 Tax=Achromobacter sp. TaxID=134375 RepID=UPI003D093BBD
MIRLARSTDLAFLPDIERSAAERFQGTAMAWAAAGDPLPPADLAQAAAAGLLWVASGDDGLPAGFALAQPMDGDLFLAEMSVALPMQGRGLGRDLLRAVVEHARAARVYRGVALTTDRELPWNGPFYRRQGFAEVPDAQLAPALRARLRAEADAGFDPARRCAMRLTLPG